MGRKLDLNACKSGKDFIRYAEQRGADIRPGKGSHNVVSTSQGQCVVPVHAGDLGKGLACKIRKTFVAIGLLLLLGQLVCLITAFML